MLFGFRADVGARTSVVTSRKTSRHHVLVDRRPDARTTTCLQVDDDLQQGHSLRLQHHRMRDMTVGRVTNRLAYLIKRSVEILAACSS